MFGTNPHRKRFGFHRYTLRKQSFERVSGGMSRGQNDIVCIVRAIGGLDPENVARAIAKVRPFGVDVASGVEAESGRKDPRLLRAFLKAARSVEFEGYDGGEHRPFDWEEHQ